MNLIQKDHTQVLCKTRAQKSMGTTTELISLCKEVKFGKEQIPNMILLLLLVVVLLCVPAQANL